MIWVAAQNTTLTHTRVGKTHWEQNRRNTPLSPTHLPTERLPSHPVEQSHNNSLQIGFVFVRPPRPVKYHHGDRNSFYCL